MLIANVRPLAGIDANFEAAVALAAGVVVALGDRLARALAYGHPLEVAALAIAQVGHHGLGSSQGQFAVGFCQADIVGVGQDGDEAPIVGQQLADQGVENEVGAGFEDAFTVFEQAVRREGDAEGLAAIDAAVAEEFGRSSQPIVEGAVIAIAELGFDDLEPIG
jgi:hypothetical protein